MINKAQQIIISAGQIHEKERLYIYVCVCSCVLGVSFLPLYSPILLLHLGAVLGV
jgi:hypothetical protein